MSAFMAMDLRGLAIGLFFLKDISLKQVIELRRDAIVVSDDTEELTVIKKTDSNQYLLLTEERKKIIKNAINLYPCDEPEYIFSIDMDSKWKKLTAQGLSGKLHHICKALGIEYKGFKHNDVIEI